MQARSEKGYILERVVRSDTFLELKLQRLILWRPYFAHVLLFKRSWKFSSTMQLEESADHISCPIGFSQYSTAWAFEPLDKTVLAQAFQL